MSCNVLLFQNRSGVVLVGNKEAVMCILLCSSYKLKSNMIHSQRTECSRYIEGSIGTTLLTFALDITNRLIYSHGTLILHNKHCTARLLPYSSYQISWHIFRQHIKKTSICIQSSTTTSTGVLIQYTTRWVSSSPSKSFTDTAHVN